MTGRKISSNHPFSLSELQEHVPKIEPLKALNFSGKASSKNLEELLLFGGFPEPLTSKSIKELRRWHKERNERLIREDVRDFSNINDLNSIQLLTDILPNKVASLLSINSIREDLEVSHRAVSHWLEILDSLYYSYRIYPYQNNKIRALKKEPKLYLWDWSEVDDEGAKFENFIANHLLKTVHYLVDNEGYKAELFYLRDKEKREVDFIITIAGKPWFTVEVKKSDTSISTPHKYFKEKLGTLYNYHVTLSEKDDYTKDGITVIPASKFLTGLL